MATITSLASTGTGHANRTNRRTPYLVEAWIDLADAVTAKGSALAQGDIIEAIKVPPGTFVLTAGFQVWDNMTGTSTDATLDMGITGVNADAYVDGFDLDGAADRAYATPATTANEVTFVGASSDTIDLLIATQTNTITGGVLRAYAVLQDVSYQLDRPNIAQRQS
jgi:hypothetical protein